MTPFPPTQATLVALQRARHREALVATAAVTDEIANRDPLTKPQPLPVPPIVERPLVAWPWRVLGAVALILWGLSCAAAALAVAAFTGFALVVAVIALAAWIPVPVTAVVIGIVLFLGAWAVCAR